MGNMHGNTTSPKEATFLFHVLLPSKFIDTVQTVKCDILLYKWGSSALTSILWKHTFTESIMAFFEAVVGSSSVFFLVSPGVPDHGIPKDWQGSPPVHFQRSILKFRTLELRSMCEEQLFLQPKLLFLTKGRKMQGIAPICEHCHKNTVIYHWIPLWGPGIFEKRL